MSSKILITFELNLFSRLRKRLNKTFETTFIFLILSNIEIKLKSVLRNSNKTKIHFIKKKKKKLSYNVRRYKMIHENNHFFPRNVNSTYVEFSLKFMIKLRFSILLFDNEVSRH